MAKKERRDSVIAVLDGSKKAVSSLTWLFRSSRCPLLNDDLLVLVLLNPTFSADTWPFCCFREQQYYAASPCEGQGYIKFLQDQIAQQRQTYLKILRPFYDNCKNLGVKFEVKVFAGPYPKAAVASEATCFKPTLIIMDRSLVDDEWLRLGCKKCQLVSVDDNGEAEFQCAGTPQFSSFQSWTSVLSCQNDDEDRYCSPAVVERGAPPETAACGGVSNRLDPLQLIKLPLELSSEDIGAMTDEFRVGRLICSHERVDVFKGFLPQYPSELPLLVKRCSAAGYDSEAEKRVSRFMFHKNILSPIGFHNGSSFSALVYLYPAAGLLGTLDQYLSRVKGRPSGLTCPERMKIAIGVGLGLQYMHEECPGGAVIHGDLRACNIFLGRDFQPMISGFGRARWLEEYHKVEGTKGIPCSTPSYNSRRLHGGETTSNLVMESLALMKADVFSFGVLLLRLFGRRPLPEDDRQLVDWASPLLVQGANHELLDHDMEELDTYETYRVISAATQCTKTRSLPRVLSMSQVVSILRGERSSVPESSPSSESSVGIETPAAKFSEF